MGAEEATVRPAMPWEDVRYDADGLCPVVVQSAENGTVLMLAWADREAVRRTVRDRRAWFWSRSRQELWRKGDTSGNAQHVLEVRWDCDADTLLYLVRAAGPACHTGHVSCFYRGEERAAADTAWSGSQLPDPQASAGSLGTELDRLGSVIAARRRDMPEASYVAGLLRAGRGRVLQKVGEEVVEAILAGTEPDRAHVAAEFADLFFHALVALAALDVPAEDVARELGARAASRPARGSSPEAG